jgi:hypothetical protein
MTDKQFLQGLTEQAYVSGTVVHPARELARKILEAIERIEEEIGDVRSIVTTQDVVKLLKLKGDIKDLCQEELNKQ